MPFHFQQLAIPDIILIEAKRFGDDRGYFMETYKVADFAANRISVRFVQDNYSHSRHGVLRGLHYQTHPHAQGKLVMALNGEIFDVAVDIRQGSPTYGRWLSETLSSDNGRMIYIPPGFAHGFCVLSETADVIYKVTANYAPDHDRGIHWHDPEIGIDWPIDNPQVSTKDAQLPALARAENNFEFHS